MTIKAGSVCPSPVQLCHEHLLSITVYRTLCLALSAIASSAYPSSKAHVQRMGSLEGYKECFWIVGAVIQLPLQGRGGMRCGESSGKSCFLLGHEELGA
jgi:hypothetical protein